MLLNQLIKGYGMEVKNNLFENHITNPECLVSENPSLHNMSEIVEENSADTSYLKFFMSKISANLKHVLNFMLIIIMVITISMSSFKKAEAGMLLGDHRYTTGAVAADMSQCAALIALWYAARVAAIATFQAMIKSLWVSCAIPSPYSASACTTAGYLEYWHIFLSDVIAAGVLFAAWLALETWAESTRQSVHILNNFDEGDPNYCEKFDHRNDVYKYGPINSTYGDCNQTIYTKNNNYNKIAIYYDDGEELPTGESGSDIIDALGTGSPPDDRYVWISPYDCDILSVDRAKIAGIEMGVDRWICAYEEDGQICADVVFCTSLEIIQFIKYALPGMFFFNKVTGYVADPIMDSSQVTRNCGRNPWTGSSQDDYEDGKGRCECACCDGTPEDVKESAGCNTSSGVQDSAGSDVAREFDCITFNERYRAHCIPRGNEDIDIDPPVVAPTAVSAYCDANVNVGYTPFPLAGKIMRCFDKTINNVFYGTREIVEYDETGQIVIEDGAIVLTKQCVEGNMNSEGFCDSSLFMKIMEAYKDVIRLMLVLFVTFIGVKMMMGANYAFPDLFKMIMKISLVMYFAMGDAWRDGYYSAIMSLGSELGAEFYEVKSEAQALVEDSMEATFVESGETSSYQCTLTNTANAQTVRNSLDGCDFSPTSGYDDTVYEAEDQHFVVWDILDCKFATYTGFTVTKTFPYLVSFAWAMLLSVSTGFMTLIAAFAILYASLTVMLTALYIGILTLFNITLLIYIAPLVIPLVLFEQTKSIFSKWLSMLLGYSLQPMVLFAVLAFLFEVLDQLFEVTMPQIFASEVVKKDIMLGISGYTVQSGHDMTFLVISMLKFTIAMVIISSFFNKIVTMISSLTGAGMAGMPKVSDLKKAAMDSVGKAGKLAYKTGKYSQRAASSAKRNYDNKIDQFRKESTEKLSRPSNDEDKGGGS